MTPLPALAERHCNNVLNRLHACLFFSPDLDTEMARIGIDDPRAAYFATRSAALGAVGAGTVTATFHNFNPALVARHVPAVWRVAPPERVLEARLRAADATLRRLLGEEAVASDAMAEAAALALRAAGGCTPHTRPLYAAHADLPVPDAPHLALWHAATLLREHRGDAHVVALLTAGLDPLEAVVSHTATGKGMAVGWLLSTRGWSRADWDAAAGRLRRRGLLADGDRLALTEEGAALRAEIEEATDRMDRAPYEHLGAEGVARLVELGRGFLLTAVAAGAFPASATGRG